MTHEALLDRSGSMQMPAERTVTPLTVDNYLQQVKRFGRQEYFQFKYGEFIVPFAWRKADLVQALAYFEAIPKDLAMQILNTDSVDAETLLKRHNSTLNNITNTFEDYGIWIGINEIDHEFVEGQPDKALTLIDYMTNKHVLVNEKPQPKLVEMPQRLSHLLKPTDMTHSQEVIKTDLLRLLVEEGTNTDAQICEILYPGVPVDIGRNNLKRDMIALRKQIASEGFYIPDGRYSPNGVRQMLPHSVPVSTSAAIQSQLESDNEDEGMDAIPDRIQRRVEIRQDRSKPKLTFTPSDIPGTILTRIETPRGRTRPLSLTLDEAYMFETVFSTQPKSPNALDMFLTQSGRGDGFITFGSFERTFNRLNDKLASWGVCLATNNEGTVIIESARFRQPPLVPVRKKLEEDEEEKTKGRIRNRRPSHGKLTL